MKEIILLIVLIAIACLLYFGMSGPTERREPIAAVPQHILRGVPSADSVSILPDPNAAVPNSAAKKPKKNVMFGTSVKQREYNKRTGNIVGNDSYVKLNDA